MNSLNRSLVNVLLSIKEKHPAVSLVDIALHHRILPLVAREPEKFFRHLTKEEIEKVKHHSEINRKKTIVRAMELCSLAKLFNENGIDFRVLKGIPLSMELYGDIGMRQSKDIDILVRKEDYSKVILLLKDTHDIDCDSNIKYLHHFSIKNKTSHAHTEVHSRLTELRYFIDSLNLFENKREISIFDVSIPVLSFENHLLFLIAHGAKHAWFRLMWLSDIAAFGTQKYFDLQKFLILAEKHNLSRVVISSFMTCQRVFGIFNDSIEQFEKAAQTDNKIYQLININLNSIYSLDVKGVRSAFFHELSAKLKELWHWNLLKKDLRFKFYVFEKHFFASHNTVTLPLPDKLHFLYIFLHPFLAFYRWANAKCLSKY